MNLLILRKLLSLAFTYGWLGLLYGSLFSLIPREYGYTLHPVANALVILGTVAISVGCSYAIEMRMYTPPTKFWMIIALGLVGVFAGTSAPLLYPFFFLMLMAALQYPCRDCVAFTRIGR